MISKRSSKPSKKCNYKANFSEEDEAAFKRKDKNVNGSNLEFTWDFLLQSGLRNYVDNPLYQIRAVNQVKILKIISKT